MARFLVLFALLVFAAAARADFTPGIDYLVLDPPQKTAAGKTEVIEFFSWACPHCYAFYPVLARWQSEHPGVMVRRIPVGYGHVQWAALARAFYALQTLDSLERVDAALYEAIHRDHVVLYDEASIGAWLAEHGVDRARFHAAYGSAAVSQQVAQADKMAARYQVSLVPTLAIGGRYVVTGEHDKMLAVADELTSKSF